MGERRAEAVGPLACRTMHDTREPQLPPVLSKGIRESRRESCPPISLGRDDNDALMCGTGWRGGGGWRR